MLRLSTDSNYTKTSSGDFRLIENPHGNWTNLGNADGFIALRSSDYKSLKIMRVPKGIDIEKNIKEAQKMTLYEFFLAVKSGGKWDYKNVYKQMENGERIYQDFGNYHFGIVVAAFGIRREIALRGAGLYQWLGSTRDSKFGLPIDYLGFSSLTASGLSSFGDDPRDSTMINIGYDSYENNSYSESINFSDYTNSIDDSTSE